jgi:mannosyl-3-phosphoglycerate phosphatase
MMLHTVIFSDLDGTLLDDKTYSFEPAREALETLIDTGIPLVFCTSKTRYETERWRRALANVHPFIVENGGAAYVPEGYFGPDAGFDKLEGGYGVLEFGRPYPEIRQALGGIRVSTGLPLRGFGDMTVEEIAECCNLARQDAALAAMREYDEPFIGIEEGMLPRIVQEAEARGFQVVSGGRFYHLVGGSDKGRAVRALRSFYEVSRGRVSTVGLGDSANDEPMLRAVDIPVLVRKSDGSHLEVVDLPGLIIAPYAGPEGWREAILGILGGMT